MSARSPRVVVTGGAGFIGQHVVRALEADGADTYVADLRFDPRAHGRGTRVDLTEPAGVEKAIPAGTEAIVHLAAVTSVLGSVKDPAKTYLTNVAATEAILERARALRVETVVFASTNAVVGQVPGVITERIPLAPLTPYGATKAAAEMLMSAYTAAYGVRCVSLRLTNVFGPGMGAKDSVVPRIVRAAIADEGFTVYGDGRQIRDYVHVDDVVAGVRLGLQTDAAGPVIIGSGTSTSVVALLALARQVTGAELAARHVPAKVGEMRQVVVDNSRARSLGWRPTTDLAAGLAEVWRLWSDEGDVRSNVALG